MRQIELMENVKVVIGDQCQYQLVDKDGVPIKKPTKFITNSSHILVGAALSRRCSAKGGSCSRQRGGRHALCNGSRAKEAAVYPLAVCRAILTGFRDQMLADGRLAPGAVGLNCVMLDYEQAPEQTSYWTAGKGDRLILFFFNGGR